MSFFAYYMGTPQVSFFAYYMGAPLMSVFSVTVWGPPSGQFLRILYRGPPQVSFFVYYRGPPQINFFAQFFFFFFKFYVLSCPWWGPHIFEFQGGASAPSCPPPLRAPMSAPVDSVQYTCNQELYMTI